jgi:hypothetical protein
MRHHNSRSRFFSNSQTFRLLRINCPEVSRRVKRRRIKKQRQTERTYNGQRGNYKNSKKTILKSMVDLAEVLVTVDGEINVNDL